MFKVKNLKLDNDGSDDRPYKHQKLFSEKFPSIFICSKKGSGKSMLIFNLLKACIDKNTRLVIFASTIYRDNTYTTLIRHFKKMGVKMELHQSIFGEEKNKRGKYVKTNILRELLDELNSDIESGTAKVINTKSEPEEEKEDMFGSSLVCRMFGNSIMPQEQEPEPEPEPEKKEKKKPKSQAVKLLLLFDDLSNELSDISVTQWLKINRHSKAMSIISSQDVCDVSKSGRIQFDSWLLFKKVPIERLTQIYNISGICKFTLKEFLEIYIKAVEKKYSFLVIRVANDILSERFDGKIY